MASFVSASDLQAQREERKEKRRVTRQEILEEAREKFLKEKRKQELRKEHGDDQWVAPGIGQRLKLTKKPKKDKKRKKHSKPDSPIISKSNDETPSESFDNNEDVWVVKGEESPMEVTPQEPLKRDEWMTVPLGPSLGAKKRLAEIVESSNKKEKKTEKDQLLECCDQPGQHPLELNPYWKDGGVGLPEVEVTKSSSVGDGGRSWLLRAYKRALERVEEDGISLEEIATQQWGSLDKLYSLLKSAGIDPTNPDQQRKKDYLYSRFEGERPSKHLSSRLYSKPEEPRRRGGFVKPTSTEENTHGLLLDMTESQGWKKKPLKPEVSDQSLSVSKPNPVTDDTQVSTEHHNVPSSSVPMSELPSGPPVTDGQLNALSAKIMKAEMLGNSAKIEKLKKELQELQDLKRAQDQQKISRSDNSSVTSQQREEKVIVLTKTDRLGRTRPLDKSSFRGKGGHYGSKLPCGTTHTDKGKRKKYFSDDDEYSLKSLIEQERLSTADETHAAIAKMASKFVPSSNTDDTIDDVLDSATAMKYNPDKEEKRAHQRAITENRKMTQVLDNCRLCFDNSGFEKHLLVALGINVYLALPSVQSLTDGHCLLVPMEHTVSSLQLDENVWSEIAVYRKGLTRMFSDRDMDVVFMETYYSATSKSHMFIECIPLPKEVGELAPMYFKKAIQESDVEWSDNKKVVDTSKKGVRGSLPVGLPYFFVEFGTDGGFGHIVEDQSKFPPYFGKEVCGGMLDAEPRLWLKPHRESFEKQKEKVIEFSEWWKSYDWTQQLKEEEKI